MKICLKCGKKLNEDDKFCSNCGFKMEMEEKDSMIDNHKNQDTYNQYLQTEMYEQSTAVEKSKAPLIIGLTVGIVTLIVAVVVSILVIGRNNGNSNIAETTAENFLRAFVQMDGKKMMSYIAYSKEHKEDVEEDWGDMGNDKDMKSYKIKYKISGSRKLSEDDIEEFWYEHEDDTYVDEEDVKEITLVMARLTMADSSEEASMRFDIYVGKYKGKWKVIAMEL